MTGDRGVLSNQWCQRLSSSASTIMIMPFRPRPVSRFHPYPSLLHRTSSSSPCPRQVLFPGFRARTLNPPPPPPSLALIPCPPTPHEGKKGVPQTLPCPELMRATRDSSAVRTPYVVECSSSSWTPLLSRAVADGLARPCQATKKNALISLPSSVLRLGLERCSHPPQPTRVPIPCTPRSARGT